MATFVLGIIIGFFAGSPQIRTFVISGAKAATAFIRNKLTRRT